MKLKKPLPNESLSDLNPELASQWHQTKNGTLSPDDVTTMSQRKVWWECPKGEDHEWEATIGNRTSGSGCPICASYKIVKSNCLATLNPELSKEWHPTKNGELTPWDVSPGSPRKVWWKCPKGEDHEWDAPISDRNKGIGCAICSNYKVVNSNCLATLNPNLTKEWHPTKNGKLTPKDVHPGSSKRVWWKCHKGEDHEWKAAIYSRTGGRGCPICSGRKIVPSTCLATLHPDLSKEWDPIKNGNLTPSDVGAGSGRSVWWKCSKGTDHEWKAPVSNRVNGQGCPVCSNLKIVLSNCLATLNPDLAKQWHPIKNGKLTPYDVGAGSGKYVWWKCPNGEDHEWKAPINRRKTEITCPVCIGRRVVKSNSLETLYPELSKQWHPTKNGELTPLMIRPGSIRKVWWICSKGKEHVWKTSVKERVYGTGCPFCYPQTSGPELRLLCELKSIFPSAEHRIKINGYEVDIYIPELKFGLEYDGAFWHQNKTDKDIEKNEALESEILLIRVREKGLRKISENDIDIKTKYITIDIVKTVLQRIIDNRSVSSIVLNQIAEYMSRTDWVLKEEFRQLQAQRNKVPFEESISFLHPEIAEQWHPTKNSPMLPEHFSQGSDKRVWWKCSKGVDHEWEAIISSRTSSTRGCPICSNKKAVKSNCLATINPTLAGEWHPTKNGDLTPYNITPGSDKNVWWKCPKGEDHEWKARVYSRSGGQGCPVCSGRKAVRSNSLGIIYPELLNQWHPTRNGELTPYDVTPGSHTIVWWQDNTGKEWKETVNRRTSDFKRKNHPDQLSLFNRE